MFWADVRTVGEWLRHSEPLIAVVAALLSGGVLLGCAVTCWLSPREKDDCIFHREVF